MATEEKPKPYTDEEVEAKIVEDGLDGWYLDGGWLRRKYSTDGWPTTLMLVNTVGYICEAAYHHADLAVTWGKIWVKLSTHASIFGLEILTDVVGVLYEAYFDMAFTSHFCCSVTGAVSAGGVIVLPCG